MAAISTAALGVRLKAYDFKYEEFKDALDGKALSTGLGRPVARACVIQGIRYHDTGFFEPLRSLVVTHSGFSRALNARSIISGVLPSVNVAEGVPYCVWHPGVAPKQTYWDFWKMCRCEFPLIILVVARACATAKGHYG